MAGRFEAAFIYVVGHAGGPQKVGYTCDPAARLRGLRQATGERNLALYRAYEIAPQWAIHGERMAHWLLREYHWRLEWFNCTQEQAAAAAERAASLNYDYADYAPTTCRPNSLYDEIITLRLRKGTFASIEGVVGSRDRAQFIRDAIGVAVERLQPAKP